jgi:hypothetical protein
MIFRWVTSYNQDIVGIFYIVPVIGHGPSAECFRQTGDSGRVSDTGLMFYIHKP